MEGPDRPSGRGNFGENVAGHCKVMGHSTVSCARTAEPIDMTFWSKTRVGPKNHVLDWGADPPREGAIFGGYLGHSKALATRCRVRCKRDHSIANNVMQQKGSFTMPGKRK